MPKIFGTSILGILAATIVFYGFGYLWYGTLFHEVWVAASTMTEEAATAHVQKLGAMMYVWGVLIVLVQVLGLAFILNHAGASKLVSCAKIGAIIALLIAVPLLAYEALYAGTSLKLLKVDIAHILIAYVLVGTILSFFRGKDAIGD